MWWVFWVLAALAGPPDGLWREASTPVELVSHDASQTVWRIGQGRVALREGAGRPDARVCTNGQRHLQVVSRGGDAGFDETVASACARLKSIKTRAKRMPAEGKPLRKPPRPRLLWIVGLAWWLLLPWAFPRQREALAWAGVGCVVRLATARPMILMGVDYPYQRMTAALGFGRADAQNGDGLPALYAWPAGVFGWPAELTMHLNLALSVLAVGWMYVGALRWTGDKRVAHGAACLLAVHPAAVAMSWTEGMFPLVAALHVAALAALGSERKAERAFGALSWGLMAHVRPLQILVVPWLLLLRDVRQRTFVVGVIATLWLWRVGELSSMLWQGHMPTSGRFHTITSSSVYRAVTEHPSSLLVTDPWLSPWWFLPLALWGAARCWKRGERGLALATAGILATLMLTAVHQDRHSDLVRFQLPALGWWALWGGYALASFSGRGRIVAIAGLAGLHGLWMARLPLAPPPTWRGEHVALVEAQRALPADAVVRYRATWDLDGALASWMSLVGPARWRPITEAHPVEDGQLVWVGRADRWPEVDPLPCTLDPMEVRELPAEGWEVEPLRGPPVRVGMHRALDCAGAVP